MNNEKAIKKILEEKIKVIENGLQGIHVGNESFSTFISNGNKARFSKVAVIEERNFPYELFNFHASVKGKFSIFKGSKFEDGQEFTLSGRHEIYTNDGYVIFVYSDLE